MPFQQQLANFWKKQSASQRITYVVLVLAVLILVPVLIAWASTPSYSVAFSGLSEADAGQIIQKLDESGVPYRLKGSGTIMVPSNQVYETRLKLAREGLPQTSTVGFEVFSGNTLGMTEFTQRVNYQRALEGELERTIGSLEAVASVRVHVVTPEKTLLSEQQEPTTASVIIEESPGYTLDAAQVRAITHLVSSSVEGLKPSHVVVVDSYGNLLAGGADEGLESLAAASDDQRAAETAMAQEIRKRVQNMLDTTLGPGNSVVQASVQMDWTQREVTSNTFDPTPAAIRSLSRVSENYSADGVPVGGIPGAAANLPTPVPNEEGEPEQSYYARNEETINYEISQVQTYERIAPGQVKKISVSVMVDESVAPERLPSIQAAVSAAAGIDATRGDQVVVEAMSFDRTHVEELQASRQQAEETSRLYQYITLGAGVLGLLILFFFFQRMLRNIRRQSVQVWQPVLKPVSELALAAGGGTAGAAALESGSVGMRSLSMPSHEPGAASEEPPVERTQRTQQQMEDEQRAKVIARLTEENPATVAEIIQIWLSEDER